MRLQDAKILITGGSAGIGAAIAALAAERGASVVINGRNRIRLEEAAQRLGVAAVPGDVGKDAWPITAEAAKAMGGLNVLINNAGWGRRMTLEELDPEEFERMWNTNVLGAAMMAKYALPHLRQAGGGTIVNMASTAAHKGYAGGSAYAATKFGLSALSQCWAAELRPENVRVIQINPSEVQTGFGGRDPERALDPRKLVSADVAHAVLAALAMDDRGFIPELTIHATNPWPG